ncbi:MAG: tetratricopeptide repeat protein [Deltaproteobacteria bacterium]|jgi:tetratricopeptide (TPR) repeat protein|nr:tetratricopeptide repeat protein [Deltaproteobacteria bacterium]
MIPALRLNLRDVRRFDFVFNREMARYLPGYQFAVGHFPEDWAQVTAQVSFRGRVIGLASCRLKDGCQPAPVDVFNLWPTLVESSLEKVAFRKALITDQETGLHNRELLMAKLGKIIRASSQGEAPLGFWDSNEAPALVLALAEMNVDGAFSKEEMLDLASALKRIPETICLARLGDRRLGLLFNASPAEAQARLDQARILLLREKARNSYLLSYSLFPQDLTLDSQGPFLRASDMAQALMEKAETALQFAYGRRQPAPVIGFGQLISAYGQIIQVLPQSRVVINLGGPMGAMPGQVFTALDAGGERKSEITVFETSEGFSLAHAPDSRAARLTAGDRLVFSRIDWSGHPASGGSDVRLEMENFEKNLNRLVKSGQPTALALVRIDDHERLAAMAGDEEVRNRLTVLAEEAASLKAPELSSRWGEGALALAWTMEAEEAEKTAQSLIDKMRERFSVSVALVPWPNPVIAPEGLMAAIHKTMIESAMTGYNVLTVFGPQTLNISGDHLLAEGDLDGAIGEYQKGLILDPGHLNLLNSLGVCHGRLGDHKAALAAFEDILRQAPDSLSALFNKGCSLILNGRLEEAEESLNLAEKAAPDNFEVLFHLGRTALELGHLDKALKTLTKASEVKGHRGIVYPLLGRVLILTKNLSGAMSALKKAVKYNPDDAESLSALGALFLEQDNDREVALSLFQKSVELDPTNSLFRQRLGKLLFNMGDYKSAEHHLKSAIDYGCRAEEVKEQLSALQAIENQDAVASADAEEPDEAFVERAEES